MGRILGTGQISEGQIADLKLNSPRVSRMPRSGVMAVSWLEMASRIANSWGIRVRSKENSKRASRYLCSRQKS